MERVNSRFRRRKYAALLCALGLAAVPAAADHAVVELPVAIGAPEAAISAEDLSARVGGRPARVLDVVPAGLFARTVLYVDRLLSPPLSLHNSLLDLADNASALVELGPIEAVTAGDTVVTSVPATRSPEALAESLRWLRLRATSDGGQILVRKQFVEEAQLTELAEHPSLAVSATAGQRLAEVASLLREAFEQEAKLLSQYRNQLLSWAAADSSSDPKLLVLVGGGFDTEIETFYRQLLAAFELEGIVDEQPVPLVTPAMTDIAQTLSAMGWTVWSYSAEGARDILLEGGEEKSPASVTTVFDNGRPVERVLITPWFNALSGLKKLLGAKGAAVPEAALLAPRQVLELIARQTGGNVLVDQAQLAAALARLRRRVAVTVETPDDLGDLVPIEVVRAGAEPGSATVRRWVSRGAPVLIGVVRAEQLLDGDLAEGGLFVEALVEEDSETARLRLDVVTARSLESTEAPALERLRVQIVAFEAEGSRPAQTRELAAEQLVDGAFSIELDAEVMSDTPLVVIVEDLESGLWGGAYASVVSADAWGGVDALSGLLPTPRAIHLLAPREPLAVGRTRIETVRSDRVKKVEFYLDGKLAPVRKSTPYSVSVTLGKYPDRHSLEAVAFDAAGLEIGRDRLILNAGTGTFRVRVVSPVDSGTPGSPLTGTVTVRAKVEMPRGSELKRVQFFWNDELFATRFAPPFAQRFRIPEDGPSGFFRIEALLADGSQTEDVLFINSPGGSEQVRVELVELFTVVTDRDGRPITGLPSEAFRAFEDGVEQELAVFKEAGDLPLTVGLAIDSSASMFIKLPEVKAAATKFVNALGSAQDRAFVVRFGGGPQLVRDTTKDLNGVAQALGSLEPDGRTEIWKGIVYSLVQLQSVPGKKALIVFSDGADEDPDFSYRTCLKFARRVGVPVYVIVSNDEIYRTQGKGLTIRGFMDRLGNLARSVGGRVFVTRVGGDLASIYEQIDRELRSQYVLGYYVRDVGGEHWRDVTVDVEGVGLKARTIGGYFR